MMPWIHQYVNTDGNVYPCCIANYDIPMGNVNSQTIKEIWNSEEYKHLRLNMINGIKSDNCKKCYVHQNLEEKTETSFRKTVNDDYKEFIDIVEQTNEDGSLPELTLKYFDVRWSNLCNFKCRTCGPMFSSSWSSDYRTYYNDKTIPALLKASTDNNNLLDQFKPYLPNMKAIYFAGGEPLIMDEHYQVLDYLINNGTTDVTLRYSSNVSNLKYKNKSIMEYWKHFPKIELYASIESFGKRAEYIRHGTKWDEVSKNLQTIKNQCDNVDIQYNIVVGLWNCLTISDLLIELESSLLFNPLEDRIVLYKQIDPAWQNLRIIPKELREKSIGKIIHYTNCSNLSLEVKNSLVEIINLLKLPQDEFEKLQQHAKKRISAIDKIRNESFVDTFPELKEWYESI